MPTQFHRAAIAATFLGVSALMAVPSAAQDAAGSPACVPIKDGIKGLQCELRELDKRYDAAKATGACTGYLVAGVKDGRFTKEEIQKTAGGQITKANACDVARTFGFGRKAAAESPVIN